MRLFSAAVVVIAGALLVTGGVHAQLLSGAMPTLPQLPVSVPPLGRAVDGALGATGLSASIETLRRLRIERLLRSERGRLDTDARGEPVLRGEYLVVAPDAAMLQAIERAGFVQMRRATEGDELALDIVVLRDARGRDARRAMRDLQRAAPTAEFSYQHLYLPAGTASATTTTTTPPAAAADISARVGLIDGGVGPSAALANVSLRRFGCEGRVIPDAHATAVATRIAGGTRDTLYIADLWCGDRVGSATLGLVQALGWMARERVPVINISLVGPDNAVLARAVQAVIARGHVVVAAVGNDGPAAPPLFPASYAGVIGVSGVDARLRALPEAASGPQVDFSAPGIVDARTRGTSFAAPVVARLAAGLVPAPSADAVSRVQRTLAQRARDLGAPGRDPRYGEGFVTAF